MLQTDNIDEDYFTPASSTTLANIFENKADNRSTENESLKYTPPKPQNVAPKSEEIKATQCVFACALYGYEWCNDDYTPKGKLGFAIVKIIKTGFHNLVLYDSNKTTLSSTTVSPTLEICVKNNVYISYFDNMQKYWNLYSTEEEVKKISNILKSLNVGVKLSCDTEKGLPTTIKKDSKTQFTIEAQSQIDRESDTDSMINKRTKQSILNRMANMGHSVLPPNTLATEKTSDSSDTNDSNSYSKTVRHKPLKGNIKRNSTDKSFEIQSLVEAHKTTTKIETNIESAPPLYTFVSGHLVPVTKTNILMGSSNVTNELNMFMSEQRVSSSETRICMTRVADKVDQVLTKVSDLAHCTNNLPSNFQNEILQKLLNEYEAKIKTYENIIKTKNKSMTFSEESFKLQPNSEKKLETNNEKLLNEKLSEVLKICEDKDSEISLLQSELTIIKEKFKNMIDLETKNLELFKENQSLKQELRYKNEEYKTVSEKLKNAFHDKKYNDETIDISIKNILNDTFHAISANFESNENYMGEAIKSIIANVIKTAFENLKQE